MLISGTGITSFNAKIKVDFKPVTTFSFMQNWKQLSSGKWIASDRGAANDLYTAENVRLYGTESVINNFIAQIELNRTYGNSQIVLSNINSQEHIFGADVDYSQPITAEIFVDRRIQGTLKGFGVAFKLVAVFNSTSFISGNGSLPVLKWLDIKYDGDANRTVNKLRSYAGWWTNSDHASDDGTFTGTFTFTDYEIGQLRRYIATQRTATVTVSNILGVANPFGRMSTGYPYGVKIIAFEDQGMIDSSVKYWKASLTFAIDVYIAPALLYIGLDERGDISGYVDCLDERSDITSYVDSLTE